jgi:hypothetical protein
VRLKSCETLQIFVAGAIVEKQHITTLKKKKAVVQKNKQTKNKKTKIKKKEILLVASYNKRKL